MTLSCKVSGVHWWYHTPSRAAEATTGYYGDVSFDSYGEEEGEQGGNLERNGHIR